MLCVIRHDANRPFSVFLACGRAAAGAGLEVQQHQGEEELHRHAGLPAEHHQRLLADGVPGELPGHRDDHQGGGEREGG